VEAVEEAAAAEHAVVDFSQLRSVRDVIAPAMAAVAARATVPPVKPEVAAVGLTVVMVRAIYATQVQVEAGELQVQLVVPVEHR